MIKTSLIGAICLPFFVKSWNTFENMEMKQYVRTLLISDDTMQIHKGLQRLFEITEEVFKNSETTSGASSYIFSMCCVYDIDYNQAIEKVRSEVAFYFASMLKAGYKHRIPMPLLGYSTGENPDA